MLMWTWRDLSWPVIAIFFWWLVGRSIEALLYSRIKILSPTIALWQIVVAIPVSGFGAIWAVSLCIDRGTITSIPVWMPAFFGIMWFVLGATTPFAFSIQRRLRGRIESEALDQAPLLTAS